MLPQTVQGNYHNVLSYYIPVGISLRLQGKLGFPYNVQKCMVKYVLLR